MQSPTRSELEILEILWSEGEATAQTVNTRLSAAKPVGYTGTLKLMQLMHQKGLLDRRREGRSHVYVPLISEAEAKSGLLHKFIDATFGGSASRMMMQLLGNKKVSKQELEEIRRYLDQLEEDDQ
ncbi:BlaI/MecI/CopY family transcriptional regulator [Marinimicrobium sp. ABcell2]|uniref:BlaI/MecI/CopY family transcriptional regulator n=1 Tax=Marinimicrobium sp. ABcell2 TaxID=3069751 RepID=UPI0027B0952C|nr:BlaI/MecI/CopY family transcriptional regulator [Marinimicrobium sp. ABcell2]MDQ2076420.1 BlaI/MecI/CopY family transcriptional regulator [Marinimicrobium sp. ABcell2]